MTAQIPDSLLLQDRKLSIVGVNGRGLFDPAGRGLQPVPRLTSCWRGYVCTYKTLYNKFLLDKLELNLGGEGPVIDEVKPLVAREDDPLGVLDLRTHRASLEDAPAMYETFQKKADGCIKVVLDPSLPKAS